MWDLSFDQLFFLSVGDLTEIKEKSEADSPEVRQGSTQGSVANADDKEEVAGAVWTPTSEKYHVDKYIYVFI